VSRFGDYDGDGDERFNGGDLWTHRAHLALSGKRGRAALAELRAALLALPEKRLIEGALCTVGIHDKIEAVPATRIVAGQHGPQAGFLEGPFEVENYERSELTDFLSYDYNRNQGEGVCAIGAYVWWQKVKAGMGPEEAFAAMDVGTDESATTDAGTAAGLTFTLAWELANRNDEQYGGLTPEGRYSAFLRFIDKELAAPPLERPKPKPKREKRGRRARPMSRAQRDAAATTPLGL